jgi:hypothetical protein
LQCEHHTALKQLAPQEKEPNVIRELQSANKIGSSARPVVIIVQQKPESLLAF